MKLTLLSSALLLLTACTPHEGPVVSKSVEQKAAPALSPEAVVARGAPAFPRAPAEIEATLKQVFPNAMPSAEVADSLLSYLDRKYEIKPKQILFGVSTCVDDVIYTKNFRRLSDIKGPFHLGGLAGLPFTGISGLEAFAHHIPPGGTMLIMVEPHLGFSEKKGWGYIVRPEQTESTPCCGALMGTLAKLQAGTLRRRIHEEDYQGDKIAELALRHKHEVLQAANPIIALTHVTSEEAEKQIRAHVLDVDLRHVKYVVIMTGTLINTDFSYSDYEAVDHVLIYDARTKQFVEDVKPPFALK